MEPSPVTPVASSAHKPGLHWGIKHRFLQYIARTPDGQCSVTDGAAVDENDRFHFALEDINLTAGPTGAVTCLGDVRFAGHHGMLFVSIADPVLHIEGNRGQLSIAAASEPDTHMGHDTPGRLVLAEFDLDAAPDADADRGTVRTHVGTSVRLSSEALDIFNGIYPPGEPLDDFTLVLPDPDRPHTGDTVTPTTTTSPATPTRASLDEQNLEPLLVRLRSAKQAGINWLSDRVAHDGSPDGYDVANSWWRAPWALYVAGAPDVAAAMMGWAERHALTDDGDLRPGSFSPPGPTSPVYYLSPLAIASWLLGRYDTAAVVNDKLRSFQDPETGGAYDKRDFTTDDLQENLKTAQLGISALITGRRDIADGVYGWLRTNLADQPELPGRLYTSRRAGQLITEFPEGESFLRVVDFSAPRQTYFHPGIAAAFAAGYSQQTGDQAALQLGRDYLKLSSDGTEEQFTDQTSVQICKFGWGAAAMLTADPTGGHLPWAVRMAEWFIDRQRPDGAWAPSSFTTPEPQLLDLYWKTAEHLMELSYIGTALRAHG